MSGILNTVITYAAFQFDRSLIDGAKYFLYDEERILHISFRSMCSFI